MNAIIMAAGMSSRFAPLSYEKPKGLLQVKGEILIERQIRQLHVAGIKDITLVVGYKKELFLYLREKYGVEIVINDDYYKWNNTSTLIRVLDKLGDTFICSSDNYFEKNVFLEKPECAYYSAVYSDGPTDEWCLKLDSDDNIIGVSIGGSDSWYMMGHVFFSRDFSAKFREILKKEYDNTETKENLWEHMFAKHLDELRMKAHKYSPGVIYEFDSLDDLRAFDSKYVNDTGSAIMHNICSVLNCSECEIRDIHAIKQGLTNTSFYFSVISGQSVDKYVYRHPGVGTESFIDRNSEVFSMKIAKQLGLDETFIFLHPDGWKLSKFIENAKTLDYHNDAQVNKALSMVRKLHKENIKSKFDFHIWSKTLEFVDKVKEVGRRDYDDFDDLFERMETLYYFTKQDGINECLCHCDCYDPNFLIGQDGKMYLIDWEYSGNDDPASDIGTFICCSDYSFEQSEDIITRYLGRKPTEIELRHYFAYVGLAGYYWYVWAIFQVSVGNDVGDYLQIWHDWADKACEVSTKMYKNQ